MSDTLDNIEPHDGSEREFIDLEEGSHNVEMETIAEEESRDLNHRILNSIADVFQQAQRTYAGHRKHIAVLKKIQSKAYQQGYSEAFNYWFNKLVTKIFPLKKKNVVGDRIVKLVAAFIASLDRECEIIRNEREKSGVDNPNAGDLLTDKEKMTATFIDGFIRHVLRGIESKDRNVRFRVTQLLVVIMDNIGEIDEELYNLLMWSMNKRIFDKEPLVRIQAVFCLTKFQSDIDESSKDPDSCVINEATRTLMQIVQNDPSAEVRRAAMLNIINTTKTRSHILERARDVNPINRRLVYSRGLKSMGKTAFDHVEPRILDQLIEWGLKDREPLVRKACEKLITSTWINLWGGDLITFLENLHVCNSTSAPDIMLTLFRIRKDIISKIKFSEGIWKDLTVEIAFLFRCFYLYCVENKLIEILDENAPEATVLAEYLKFYIDERYSSGKQAIPNPTKSPKDLEFIIEQLLITASRYDYSDEVGRRSMLTVIRNMLGLRQLPELLIKLGTEVLQTLSINDRDFITMAIEIINDIRDDDVEQQEHDEVRQEKLHGNSEPENSKRQEVEEEGDEEVEEEEEVESDAVESFHSAVGGLEHANKSGSKDILTNVSDTGEIDPKAVIHCLTRACHMLELVDTPLEQNVLLSSLIDTLIIPALRSGESKIRELGVRSLGLCCLLDAELASENMFIFGMCISKGNAALKKIALQVVIDMFAVHGNVVVDGENKVDSLSIYKIFYKVLKNDKLPECQSVAAEGLCKLFLADIFTDDDLFEALILSYFSPLNTTNEALIQAFAFCIPVYCFSHVSHQQRMSRVASDVLLRLCMLWDETQNSEPSDEDRIAMMKPNVIFQELIFWTDPRKLVGESGVQEVRDSVQLQFLVDILKAFSQIENKVIRKMLLTNINSFFISSYQDYSTLKKSLDYVDDILDNATLDTMSRNAVQKFKTTLTGALQEADNRNNGGANSGNDSSMEEYSMILESSVVIDKNLANDGSDTGDDESEANISSNGEEPILANRGNEVENPDSPPELSRGRSRRKRGWVEVDNSEPVIDGARESAEMDSSLEISEDSAVDRAESVGRQVPLNTLDGDNPSSEEDVPMED